MSVFGAVTKKLVETRQKITAYHGSPHDFDRFSSENIGTGEGAQAYGHGLYFAGREGTAKSYRDALTEPRFTFDGKPADAIYTDEIRDRWSDVYDDLIDEDLVQDWKLNYLDSVSENGGDYDKASDQLDLLVDKVFKGTETTYDFERMNADFITDIDVEGIYDLNENQRLLDSVLSNMSQADSPSTMQYVLDGLSPDERRLYQRYVEPKVEYVKPEGKMYEVNIDASPDEMLDYDLSLSEQSEYVKDKLRKEGVDIVSDKVAAKKDEFVSAFPDNLQPEIKEALDTITGGDSLNDAAWDVLNNNRQYDPFDVNDFHDLVEEARVESKGINVIKDFPMLGSEMMPNGSYAPAVSDAMSAMGIKGIKYADAQTRFSPKGKTHNFVVFDDKLIKIARKYGVTMPVAGAILAGTMTPEQAEAGVVTKAARDAMLKFFDEAEVDNAIRQAGNRKSREALTQMPIDDFLSLARDGYDPAKSAGISNVSKFDDLPFLNIRSEDGIANITGHEGRHRARRLKELGESTMPVRIKSDIRWDQQNDPKLWDYEQDYPQILFNEDGTKKSPFPFVQGDSNLLDSSALNIEDIQRKTTPTAKQIDDDELLKGLFGSSAATAVGAGALFSPGKAHANTKSDEKNYDAIYAERDARAKMSPRERKHAPRASQALRDHDLSTMLPALGNVVQGAVRDSAATLDYVHPANLARLMLDPAKEGLSRFVSKPITNMYKEAVSPIVNPILYDEEDPEAKGRAEKLKDFGGFFGL